ncbi:MAG: reverse gyrase [Patescibacteria group bacterium]
MKEKLPVFYLDICPVDKSGALVEEIYNYGLCEKDFLFFKKSLWEIKEERLNNKDLKFFADDYYIYQKLKEYKKFFEENLGYPPFKLNLYWVKRVLKGDSFSIIAPTGIGKTTFGIVISHFLKGKVYYLVPSKILLREIESKLKKIKSDKKILTIKGPEDKEKLINEDFDILVSTSNFLHKNFELIPKNFDLVFIDDADSLIRQPKNIDKVLKLSKFSDEEIERALKIIDLKRKIRNKYDFQEIEKLEINKNEKGIIIAASATLTPKTKRINLFRELLGFEIGSSTTYLRNIEETYKIVEKEKLWQESLFWIKKFGEGGFVFLSSDYNKDDLNEYVNFLIKNGIKAISYEKFNSKNRERFINNEIQVIVGFSNIRNPLTRGIDLPQKVRYSIFVGVPKFILSLKLSFNPTQLFLISLTLRELLDNEEKKFIDKNLNFLKKISFLKEENVLENKSLLERLEPIRSFWDKILKENEFIEKIENHPRIYLKKEKDGLILIVSDPRGYLQASGRTSRLFPLGLTKGFSLILTEEIKILKHLEEKLKILGYQTIFKEINEINLEEIFKKIDEDREIVKKVLRGEEFIFKDPIKTVLVIVESPTKSKTIANFFGKPARRIKNGLIIYEISIGNLHLNICATMGHFADLVYSNGYYGVEKINNIFIPHFQFIKICQNCQRHLDYKENICPICKSDRIFTKKELIESLKEIASEVDEIFLATDPDTEGEKIAFDLFNYLYPYNQNIKRIELHEITKAEFLKRINQPRDINLNLVKAQLLRRISDRWVGFYLSEKIQNHFKNLNLSAGRVQTPILGWILERHQKTKEKIYSLNIETNGSFYRFLTEDKELIKEIKKLFKEKELKISIKILSKKEKNLNPLPPYETVTLLKDAFQYLRFNSDLTMKLAQGLFENGLITYHRTDSTYISDFGKFLALEYLEKENLHNLYYPRSWGEQGTHEGIRPTKSLDVEDVIEELIVTGQRNLTSNHLKLYNLIFNRFLASQTKEAKVIKGKILISLNNLLKTKQEEILEIKEKGFLNFSRENKEKIIKEGEFLVDKLNVKRTSKIFHYSQGELIEEMKKRGLGRPSTYATFIQTLLERKYIINKSGYLIPINWGEKIFNYLNKRYAEYISESFTKDLEDKMDLVERGKEDYMEILKDLFEKIFLKKYN